MQDNQDVYSPPMAILKLDNEANPKKIKYFKGWLMFFITASVFWG